MPLTDTAIRKAKPRDTSHKLPDGAGLYLEGMPNASPNGACRDSDGPEAAAMGLAQGYGHQAWRFSYLAGSKRVQLIYLSGNGDQKVYIDEANQLAGVITAGGCDRRISRNPRWTSTSNWFNGRLSHADWREKAGKMVSGNLICPRTKWFLTPSPVNKLIA